MMHNLHPLVLNIHGDDEHMLSFCCVHDGEMWVAFVLTGLLSVVIAGSSLGQLCVNLLCGKESGTYQQHMYDRVWPSFPVHMRTVPLCFV